MEHGGHEAIGTSIMCSASSFSPIMMRDAVKIQIRVKKAQKESYGLNFEILSF